MVPTDAGRPLIYSDIPQLQFGENVRANQGAEQDLTTGVQALRQGRQNVGADKTSMLARDQLMERVLSGGVFNDEYLDTQRGALQNRAGVGLQGTKRNMEDSLAQQGITGGALASELARLEQGSSMGLQSELANLEQAFRSSQDESQRANLGQLGDFAGREDTSRQGFDRAIADAYLSNERSPIDFSVLATKIRKGKKIVGGKNKGKKDIAYA